MSEPFEPKTKNFGPRKAVMLIIHGTEVDDAQSRAIFEGKTKHEGSTHYYIAETGEVVQYLDESARAWHAGRGYWNGFTDINTMSIGIELMAISKNRKFTGPETVYTDAQIESLSQLSKNIIQRHGIAQWNILGHQDVACNRKHEPTVIGDLDTMLAAPTIGGEKKYDPGPHFPWQTLAANGVGLWHDVKEGDSDQPVVDGDKLGKFVQQLGMFGYDVREQNNEVAFSSIIRAFQTHFLPWNITGQVGEQSARAIDRLLAQKLSPDA